MSFPTRILVGPGTLRRLPAEVEALGIQRVQVVTDAGLVQTPIVDAVEEVLVGAGLEVSRYVFATKNPNEQDVLDGVAAYHEAEAGLVVGLGGGAALDVAKLIRLKVRNTLPLAEYDDSKGGDAKITEPQPPMIAIPTTAGTGSEVGRAGVVSLGADHRKVVIFAPTMMPEVAICDAELTVGLPASLTAATGIDALTHAVEAYVAQGYHPFADAFALSAIARVGTHLATAVGEPGNLLARHEMMLAASLGAISFQKGLGACHALAHPLSAVSDLHHGLANAIMLPHIIRFNMDVAEDRYARIGLALGEAANVSDRAGAEACHGRIVALIASIGLPSRLRDAGVDKGDFARMIPQALSDAAGPPNPRPLTEATVRDLYDAAW